MSIRLYVLPMERGNPLNSRGPKYLAWSRDPDPSDNVGVSLRTETFETTTPWSILNYGLHDWCIAAVGGAYIRQRADEDAQWGPWAEDAVNDAAVHSALAAKADVQQIPANLDNNVGAANRDEARAFLEAAALPGQWVQNGTAWREVVRTVAGFVLFAQRYDSLRQQASPGAPALGSQIAGNLNVQWGSIPQATRDAVTAAGQSFGYDLSFISNTTLVRAILKQLADLWGAQPVYLGLEAHNGGATFTV